MRILVIGDFHSILSKSLEREIKKLNPDLILSSGDFCGDKTLSKFFFQKIYGKNEEEISLGNMSTYNFLEGEALKKGILLINRLKKLKIPLYGIRGNWDPAPFGHDLVGKLDRNEIREVKYFEKLQSKDFRFVDMKLIEFEDFILVGGASSTSPQRLKKNSMERLIKIHHMSKREAKEYLSILKKNWDTRQKLYDNNFKKALEIQNKTGKKIIFLTHNCPYNTKLDKIKKGPAKGEHYGSYQERLVIKEYKPDIVLCGHIHENFGKDKIGKSMICNAGSAMDGKFLVMEI